jgi:hypothetical protein
MLLARIGGIKPQQFACQFRKVDTSGLPRREESCLSREDEPTLARLEVEEQQLELVGCDQNALGLSPALLRLAEVRDRNE